MIDGIKCFGVSTFSENIRNSPYLKDVEKVITENNGTVYIYPYCGLIFKIRNNSVSLYGSLHKYFNTGQNNNDFTRTQLIEVLNDLWHRFGINPHCTVLNSVEIGVNLTFQPKQFINSIIDYKGNQVNIRDNDFLYSECELSRYTVKVYDKTRLLRVEVSFNRMEDLRKREIKYLSDLTTPDNFRILGTMLLEYFDNYLTFDNTINIDSLPLRERELIINGQNPRYWKQLHQASPENYKKRRTRFKELIQANGQNNIQKEVRELIVEKLDLLCELGKTFPELTDSIKPQHKIKTFPEVTESNKPIRDDFDSSENTDFPRINILDEAAIRGKLVPEKTEKFCKITGIDISMQENESEYLTTSGVKFYYENEPEIYSELKKLIARSKFKTASLEKQFFEIAHNIRNKDRNAGNNPRNNTKRAINNLYSYPQLFPTCQYIKPEKRELAQYECN